MNLPLFNFITALWFTAISSFILGIFVYYKNRKSIVNLTFFLYSLSIAWWSFCQIWLVACDKKITALTWTRIEQVGVFFIPTFFVHFVVSFLQLKNKKILVRTGYFLSFFFATLCPTRLMMADAIPKFYVKYFATPGFAYHFAIAFFIIYILFGLKELYSAYVHASGDGKNQLKYLFWSSWFGYIGGAANFLLVYGISIPILNPFGTYAVALYVFITAYAIGRFRLLDINIAITRATSFVIIYLIVLGIPFWFGIKNRPFLSEKLGVNWWLLPSLLLGVLATIGPFIYQYLKRRTENIILKKQRRSQDALLSLSKRMTRLRSTTELFEATGTTIVDTIGASYVGIYLKDEEHNAFKIQFAHPKKDKTRFDEFLPLDHPIMKLLCEWKKPLPTSEVPTSTNRQNLYFSLIVPSFMEDELKAFIVLGSKPHGEMYTTD